VIASAIVAVASASSVSATVPSRQARPAPAAHLPQLRALHEDAKLDSRLYRVAVARPTAHTAEKYGLGLDHGRVEVVVDARRQALARRAIVRFGGNVRATAADRILAWVPRTQLVALARSSAVRFVRPPRESFAAAVTDEGVQSSGAVAWQTAGWSGAGIRVGIIDNGFDGYETAQVTGDLPPLLTTANFCDGGLGNGTAHGTAVAEIVHKMAPAAQLFLVCEHDDVQFAQAVAYAKAQGLQIVNESTSWFNTGRGDGTGAAGTPDAVVADAVANGILWVAAAGNYAQGHWSGTFTDANADGWEDFTSVDETNSFVIGAGQKACVYLKWDDWPASRQDYDLALDQESPSTEVASSTNVQSGTQEPTEDLCYTNDTGVTQWYGVAIKKHNATQRPRFDLFTTVGSFEHAVAVGSITTPASSPSVLAAGASCWQTPQTIEPFSGQGPTIDGHVKPDLVGPDRTSSSVYGAFTDCAAFAGFPGTSASSAHVSGAAALVKQHYPADTPPQLRAILEGGATEAGAPGRDNVFGAGLLRLPADPGIAPPPPPPPPPPAALPPPPAPPPPPPPAPPSPPADTQPPVIHPRNASGRHGRTVRLYFDVSDDSGEAAVTVAVFRRSAKLFERRFGYRGVGGVYYTSWRIPARARGVMRYCAEAWDRANNDSGFQCAVLRVR
jgi:hypothetical protein